MTTRTKPRITKKQARLRDAAVALFKQDEPPDEIWWFGKLSPHHQRLFAAQLSDALKQCLITEDGRALEEMIGSWEATAWVDSNPEALADIERNRREGYKNVRPIEEFLVGTPLADWWADPMRRPLKHFIGDTPLSDFFSSSGAVQRDRQSPPAPPRRRNRTADIHAAG